MDEERSRAVIVIEANGEGVWLHFEGEHGTVATRVAQAVYGAAMADMERHGVHPIAGGSDDEPLL